MENAQVEPRTKEAGAAASGSESIGAGELTLLPVKNSRLGAHQVVRRGDVAVGEIWRERTRVVVSKIDAGQVGSALALVRPHPRPAWRARTRHSAGDDLWSRFRHQTRRPVAARQGHSTPASAYRLD